MNKVIIKPLSILLPLLLPPLLLANTEAFATTRTFSYNPVYGGLSNFGTPENASIVIVRNADGRLPAKLDYGYGVYQFQYDSSARRVVQWQQGNRLHLIYHDSLLPMAEFYPGDVYYRFPGNSYFNLAQADQLISVRDRLGSVRGVARQGIVQARFDYDTAGKPTETDNCQGDCSARSYPYRYQEHRYLAFDNSESGYQPGIHDFSARLYDHGSAKFTHTDLVISGNSPYLAMADDWVNLIDPDGNSPMDSEEQKSNEAGGDSPPGDSSIPPNNPPNNNNNVLNATNVNSGSNVSSPEIYIDSAVVEPRSSPVNMSPPTPATPPLPSGGGFPEFLNNVAGPGMNVINGIGSAFREYDYGIQRLLTESNWDFEMLDHIRYTVMTRRFQTPIVRDYYPYGRRSSFIRVRVTTRDVIDYVNQTHSEFRRRMGADTRIIDILNESTDSSESSSLSLNEDIPFMNNSNSLGPNNSNSTRLNLGNSQNLDNNNSRSLNIGNSENSGRIRSESSQRMQSRSRQSQIEETDEESAETDSRINFDDVD